MAVTTQTYRSALDAAIEGQMFELSKQGQLDLQQSFSALHARLLRRERSPSPRAGPIPQESRKCAWVPSLARAITAWFSSLIRRTTQAWVKPGDGIVFDEGHPDQDEQGGRIYNIRETQFHESIPSA